MDFNTRIPTGRIAQYENVEIGYAHTIDEQTGDVVPTLDDSGAPIPTVYRVCVNPSPAEVLRRVNVVPREILKLGGFEGYAALTNVVAGDDVIRRVIEDRTVHAADADRLVGYLMERYGLFDLLGLDDAASAVPEEVEGEDPLARTTGGALSAPRSQDGKDAAST